MVIPNFITKFISFAISVIFICTSSILWYNRFNFPQKGLNSQFLFLENLTLLESWWILNNNRFNSFSWFSNWRFLCIIFIGISMNFAINNLVFKFHLLHFLDSLFQLGILLNLFHLTRIGQCSFSMDFWLLRLQYFLMFDTFFKLGSQLLLEIHSLIESFTVATLFYPYILNRLPECFFIKYRLFRFLNIQLDLCWLVIPGCIYWKGTKWGRLFFFRVYK